MLLSPVPRFRRSISIPSPNSNLSKKPRSNNAVTEVFSGKYTLTPKEISNSKLNSPQEYNERAEFNHEQKISKELMETIKSIAYIADHMKAEMTYKKVN